MLCCCFETEDTVWIDIDKTVSASQNLQTGWGYPARKKQYQGVLMLTIALPKGRIAEETLAIFEEIFESRFLFESRRLILETGGFRF